MLSARRAACELLKARILGGVLMTQSPQFEKKFTQQEEVCNHRGLHQGEASNVQNILLIYELQTICIGRGLPIDSDCFWGWRLGSWFVAELLPFFSPSECILSNWAGHELILEICSQWSLSFLSELMQDLTPRHWPFPRGCPNEHWVINYFLEACVFWKWFAYWQWLFCGWRLGSGSVAEFFPFLSFFFPPPNAFCRIEMDMN